MKVKLTEISFSKMNWPVEGAPERWMEQHGLVDFFEVDSLNMEFRYRPAQAPKEIELPEFNNDLPPGVEISFIGIATRPLQTGPDGRAQFSPEIRKNFEPSLEKRTFPIQFRVVGEDGDSPILEGHAAVFNKEINIFGMNEVIRPGAFKRALREKQDIRALFNHEPSLILGRTKAKTLTLKEDKVGLFTEIKLADTTVGRDLAESVRRGDVDGMSFAFRVRKQNIVPGTTKKLALREILDVDLFDVSPVTFPAFTQTDVGLKSEDPEGEEHGDDFRQKRQRLAELSV